MFVCSCSNPACQVNGCQIAAGMRQQCYYALWNVPPVQTRFYANPAPPLTADDIRRIVREELAARVTPEPEGKTE